MTIAELVRELQRHPASAEAKVTLVDQDHDNDCDLQIDLGVAQGDDGVVRLRISFG